MTNKRRELTVEKLTSSLTPVEKFQIALDEFEQAAWYDPRPETPLSKMFREFLEKDPKK
jgi:hypothetical protein